MAASAENGTIKKRQDGRWLVRLTHFDERGRRRDIRRIADSRTEAREELQRLRRTLHDQGTRALEADRLTFADLADYYERTYLIPAEYRDGRKVAGLRGLRGMPARVQMARDYFGRRRLRGITHGDLEQYRAHRLNTPTRSDAPRSIATVNREMAVLRRVFNIARKEGWIARNPFEAGDPLITIADERPRERILTREEEERLLAACTDRRAHLRPIIIAALDTGMRKGELFKLTWEDVDFAEKIIRVQAFNTKTMRERVIAMTARLERTLAELLEATDPAPDALLFGILDTVKKAFASVRRVAGLPDLRFHDLRHTAATRLVTGNVPLQEVGRVLGHTQPVTTYRYVNANLETARRAAAALDAFHVEPAGESDRVN